MTRWIGRLAPDAPAPLLLAARGQHLRRWEIPRAAYPMTRAGYHAWRKAQAEAHAGAMRKILAAAGFEEAVIERTASLLRKERLGSDPEVAALEDAACLVFLERDLDDFAARHDEEKVIGILRKTWGKMSPRGQEEARRLLPNLAAPARALVERALA